MIHILAAILTSSALAAPLDVVCKRVTADSVQNLVYSKVSLPAGNGTNATFYAPVAANEVRFVKPSTLAAGANGQNLHDGECSFRDVGVSPSFTSIQLDISGNVQLTQSLVTSSGNKTQNNNYTRFGQLSFKTLAFKADVASSGSTLILKIDGSVNPVILP